LRFHMGMCIPDGLVYNGELHALPCGNQQEWGMINRALF
jgi:hypothetical protein